MTTTSTVRSTQSGISSLLLPAGPNEPLAKTVLLHPQLGPAIFTYLHMDRQACGALPRLARWLRDDSSRGLEDAVFEALFREHWPSAWCREAVEEARTAGTAWKKLYKARHLKTYNRVVKPTDRALVFNFTPQLNWQLWKEDGGGKWKSEDTGQLVEMTEVHSNLILFNGPTFTYYSGFGSATGDEAQGDITRIDWHHERRRSIERYCSAKGFFRVCDVCRIMLLRYGSIAGMFRVPYQGLRQLHENGEVFF